MYMLLVFTSLSTDSIAIYVLSSLDPNDCKKRPKMIAHETTLQTNTRPRNGCLGVDPNQTRQPYLLFLTMTQKETLLPLSWPNKRNHHWYLTPHIVILEVISQIFTDVVNTLVKIGLNMRQHCTPIQGQEMDVLGWHPTKSNNHTFYFPRWPKTRL